MTVDWLTGALPDPRPESLLFLRRAEVVRCLAGFDVVETVRAALISHHRGETLLPSEAYLTWPNSGGAYTRSIGMPGAVRGAHGMKIINASVSNPALGMERAGGLGLCFDPETARITTAMEVGVLSAVRTAAVSAVALSAIGMPTPSTVGVIGCGTQARVHLALLLSRYPDVRRVLLFDHLPDSAGALAEHLAASHPDLPVTTVPEVRDAVAEADLALFTTTASEGYVPPDWIAPGAVLVNVSLGDLTDDTLLSGEALYVDDVHLIAENPRRPLGRLLNEGRMAAEPTEGTPSITATIGALLTGTAPTPHPEKGHVVVNPFGLGVLDVALFDAVRAQARATGEGHELSLF